MNEPSIDRCSFCDSSKTKLWRHRRAAICSDCVHSGLTGLLARAGEAAAPFPGPQRACSFCETDTSPGRRHDAGDRSICGDCLAGLGRALVGRPPAEEIRERRTAPQVVDLLDAHFPGHDLHALATQVRVFPERMRADVQAALDEVLGTTESGARVLACRDRWGDHQTLQFPALIARSRHEGAEVAPLQFIEVDVGDAEPRRCVKTALWLAEADSVRHAVLLSPEQRHGSGCGLHIEVATPAGEAGARIAQRLFARIEAAVRGARSYRGKVLSLERARDYSGRSTGIKVHRLRAVARDEVILPERTLALLERNVFDFHAARAGLKKLGLPVKKGLLFHGPPGTGKTHTIHYLAARLEGHTTLLVTAEQVGLLDEYVALARLLQPSVIVIEDADLIARDRARMESACEEVLLNKLLNEMDGLREDAEILFILTTNRPETIEAALVSRPGRIDQAIEFPLPDDSGRRKLIRLYARGLDVDDAVVAEVARRTDGVSAAFLKELLRRTAQTFVERGGAGRVALADVDRSLEEMLFAGGRLNVRILGGKSED